MVLQHTKIAWGMLLFLCACGGGHSTGASGSSGTVSTGGDTVDASVGGSDGGTNAATGDDAGGLDAGSVPAQPATALPSTLRNYVFVTSTTQAASFGGLINADILCNAAAKTAGLPGNYVAWLSTSGTNAKDRVSVSARGWVRTDGLPFAVSYSALIEGAILYPPRLDENAKDLGSDATPVFTATKTDGTYYVGGTYSDCAGWTSTDATNVLRAGSPSGATQQWTAASGPTCAQHGRLYCFGIDNAVSVAAPKRSGRFAFLSRGAFVPGPGLVGADTLCSSEAKAAGLLGPYLALLASDGKSAAGRFGDGKPWVRFDGVAIADRAADLFGGKPLLAPISLQLDGQYLGSVAVWTGADTVNRAPATDTYCASWNDQSLQGRYGICGDTGVEFFAFGTLPCSTRYLHLYCLQP
ncbi:MAG TPA: hypothetical protein VF331_12870 [Polyangiales bacterium]